jgi:hypothetical protein
VANIVPSSSLNIEDELHNLSLYKYHPSGIVNMTLNRLQDMLDGKVEITDPSNPFIYLLETNCLNTAFAVQEYTLLTRKLYPRLANNEHDLYLHMSDVDYLGRFSEPAYANVLFNVLFNDFTNKAHYDPVQKEYILKLPRHLKLTVDKYIFTLTSAIIIRLTENGVIDVKFENQTYDNIFPVETNYINFNILKVNQEETYLNFDLKLPEIDIESIELPLEKSKLFKNKLTFNPNRQFYYFKAFYLKEGDWREMTVTHTDEIYDINNPTCIINVLNDQNSVEYYIPPVYINGVGIGSKVKFLIYTTCGNINVNFNDYRVSDFSVEYNPVFPDKELDVYTQPLQLISKVIYIKDEVISGKNSVSFTELKKNVIDNSIGDRKLPITNKQLEFESRQNNFKLIKDVDVLNRRIFLLECLLPNATTRYPISRFNLDIIEYKTTVADLLLNKNNILRVNDRVTIIPEGTVFKHTEDGLYLLDEIECTALKGLSGLALSGEVNDNNYISTFYHYILDTGSNETDLRAYDISSPLVKRINFKEFNATARIGVNTSNVNIYRSVDGFTIDVLCNLKKYTNTINETNVLPYIVYRDGEDSRFYLEGRLFTMINENPVYRFELKSDYYIDDGNRIYITNFKDVNDSAANISIELLSDLDLIYVSNVIPTNYQSSVLDEYIYNSYLTVNRCVVTLEEVKVKFGDYLERLYTRVHTSTGVVDYESYDEDIPLKYTTQVYNENNEIIHYIGDIVYNDDGEVVYKHRVGDVKLDENDQPILINENELNRYLNLLFIDYRVTLSNKSTIKGYREYLKKYLTEKVVENAVVIQDELLDNSQAFIVVPKNISSVKVKTPTRQTYIPSMQSFRLNVYVNERVYNDIETRGSIEYMIISEIDQYLYENIVLSKTSLLNKLHSKLNEFVKSVSIESFTELNEEYIEILDSNARISLNKLLVTEADGYNIKDDVTVNFTLV